MIIEFNNNFIKFNNQAGVAFVGGTWVGTRTQVYLAEGSGWGFAWPSHGQWAFLTALETGNFFWFSNWC